MIKVTDIAYGRLQAPDLDVMEQFLTDFGMVRSARTASALYMRGTDPDHHIHVTELGEPAFLGMAFHAATEEDLHLISKADGATPVEEIDEPGGGKRVRLTDPNGLQVEIVHGMQQLEPLEVRRVTLNTGADRNNRVDCLQRVPQTASHVKRSAHCVFKSDKFEETLNWYQTHLGLRPSDIVYEGEKENVLAVFHHASCEEGYVDHHVFLCIKSDRLVFNHLSFEVADFDDVQTGHEFLKRTNRYSHVWGVGRHVLGSQIFDYWRDPWGRVHEHWTDTDMVSNKHVTGVVDIETGFANQWGPDYPPDLNDDPQDHVRHGR